MSHLLRLVDDIKKAAEAEHAEKVARLYLERRQVIALERIAHALEDLRPVIQDIRMNGIRVSK